MKRRSPAAPLLLPFITLGIYSIVWAVKTKTEMNAAGSKIPTAWWIIVPFVNIWWMWRYSVGVAEFTKNGLSDVGAFLLQFFLGNIGQCIIQVKFNQTIDAA